jgi:holliday junction DNA helicase RuvB
MESLMSLPSSTSERVRAQNWLDYVGQDRLKQRLLTHTRAARAEERAMDHMLLVAPPGCGKTTLASLIALSLGDNFAEFMMPMDIKKLAYFIDEQDQGVVILLDEIHRAPAKFQECLLTIERDYLQVSPSVRVSTRHVTFIAATTEPQKVIQPLWDRFTIQPQWEDYTDDEMAQIVSGMATRIGKPMPDDIAQGLARATGGTPRVAGALVVAWRDLLVTDQPATVEAILAQTGRDIDGLSDQHLSYLRTLKDLGGTAGLANLATMTQLPSQQLQVLERLLLKRGFIRLESTGRELTGRGHEKVPALNTFTNFSARRRAS